MSFVLQVRGSRAGVEAAVTELEESIEKNKRVEATLEVEPQHIGLLLGKVHTNRHQL